MHAKGYCCLFPRYWICSRNCYKYRIRCCFTGDILLPVEVAPLLVYDIGMRSCMPAQSGGCGSSDGGCSQHKLNRIGSSGRWWGISQECGESQPASKAGFALHLLFGLGCSVFVGVAPDSCACTSVCRTVVHVLRVSSRHIGDAVDQICLLSSCSKLRLLWLADFRSWTRTLKLVCLFVSWTRTLKIVCFCL